MLRVLVGDYDEDDLADALARAGSLHPELEHLLPAVAGITMAPTMVGGSTKRNVMPSRAWVELDCRIQPGMTEADVEAAVRARLGDDLAYDLSWPEPLIAGGASPPDGPVIEAVRSFLPRRASRPSCCPASAPGSRTRRTCARPPAPRRTASRRTSRPPRTSSSPATTTPTSASTSTTCTRRCASTCTWPRPCWDEGARPRHPDRRPRAWSARRDHRRRRRAGRARDRRSRATTCAPASPSWCPTTATCWSDPVYAAYHRLNGNGEMTGLALARGGRAAALPVAHHQHPQRRRRARRAGRASRSPELRPASRRGRCRSSPRRGTAASTTSTAST